MGSHPTHCGRLGPGEGKHSRSRAVDGDGPPKNLEEELALFLVFGQPEVEGRRERHSRSAVSLTTRSPSIGGRPRRTIPLPATSGGWRTGKSVLISRELRRGRGKFFVAKGGPSVAAGTCDDGRFIRLAGSGSLYRREWLYIVYNCLFVGDREGVSRTVTGQEDLCSVQKWRPEW
ncbi:hypothetical protein GWK47_027723 [Chionoecetes opilio]|uniref:Uncharacterized protein n=1 Tax=Chionoecetes opilio TaxID=41210 RepID=A0A8J8WBI4_CHIOP|nr:hypothetical protein GWK47_027723 [Chionoecetes opilio]